MTAQEVRQSPDTESRFFYGYIIVMAALIIIVVTTGAATAFGIFFIPLLTEFGWTRAMTSGAFSLSRITGGLIGIVMGGITDRFGPRMVLTVCCLILGLGYLLMSRIGTVWQLYLFLGVIIGIGGGGNIVPLLSTVPRWFVSRRGIMTGIVMTGTCIGGLIAPPVANWLIATYGWRISYIVMGGVVLVVIVLVAQLLRRDPARMGLVPYGESKAGEQGPRTGAWGFSLREAVFTRQLWMVFTMFFCLSFNTFAITVHLAPHAIGLGISAATAANILATVGGVGIAGRIILGNTADRIGNRSAFVIGFTLMLIPLLWLMQATEIWMLFLCAAIFGFAHAGAGAPTSPLVAQYFGLSSHGVIFGVTQLGFSLGGAVGPFIAGYIFDVTGSYRLAFLICAAVAIVGLVLTVFLTPITGEPGKMKAI